MSRKILLISITIASILVSLAKWHWGRDPRQISFKVQLDSDLFLLGLSLDAFRLDIGRIPTEEEGLYALMSSNHLQKNDARNWHGPYLKKWPMRDPWGHEYRYGNLLNDGSIYYGTFSKDNKKGGEQDDSDILIRY